jgi:hypothetical protein
VLVFACLASLVHAAPLAAQATDGGLAPFARGLVASAEDGPLRAEPGSTFSFLVQPATAVTPPPGVQEPRAHRAFSVWLCAQGLSLGAPARLCFPLAVADLRPEASHSLAYRLHVSLPRWVAPGSYELGVRFPGGSALRPGGLRVGAQDEPSCELRVTPLVGSPADPPAVTDAVAAGLRVENPCSEPVRARLHLAGAAGLIEPKEIEAYPLPTESGQFGQGIVALLPVAAGQSLTLRARASPVALPALTISARPVGEAARMELRVSGGPAQARTYWWLSPWESGVGPRVSTPFGGSRSPTVVAVAIAPDGSLARASFDLAAAARPARETGLCQFGDPSGFELVAGLLFLLRSRKIRRARRHPVSRARE